MRPTNAGADGGIITVEAARHLLADTELSIKAQKK